MDKVFHIKSAACLAASLFLLSVSCSDVEQTAGYPEGGQGGMVPLAIKGMPYRNSADGSADVLSEVSLFHFNGDEFLFRTDIADPYAEDIMIPTGATSRIFCISGLDLSAEEGISKQEDFARSVVSYDKAEDLCPLFYSAVSDLDADAWHAGTLEVALERSVARIDFSNAIDPDVMISQVTVVDAPAAAYVFPADGIPSEETISLTKEFDTPFQGSEPGLFFIFPSSRPVHFRILGEYGDSPLNVEAVLPAVERNRIYSLQVVNVNSRLEGAFTVKPWEEGAGVDATPDKTAGISIDKVNSGVPSGVDVDYMSGRVSVPASGADGIKLAFVSSSPISVASVEGDVPSVGISVNDPVNVEEGYICSFNVDVAPQPNGASAYSVMLHLRDDEGRYGFVEIAVPAYHYIETVNIAGSEWMCFNAVSADPDVQVFPFEGISVEEMYRSYWAQSIGSFFQYGRQLGYDPWTRNDPNGNSETERDIPWASPECMPVPAGYHVASAEEWFRLFPAGTVIPSVYTAGNGEEIKAELVTLPGTLTDSPSASANRANLLMRYVRLESLQTGNVLILPICGQKTASWDEYPGSGRIMHTCVCYWIADDRCVWVIQESSSDGEVTFGQHKDRWNYDGFLPVRGIKNND